MKGLGNYRFGHSVERKPGVLMMYRGGKAVVRFHNGSTYALPAESMKKLGLEPDMRFILVVVRDGKSVIEVRVELTEARPARPRQTTPRVYHRDGQKLITRKP